MFKNQSISEKSRLNSLFSIEVIVISRFTSSPHPQDLLSGPTPKGNSKFQILFVKYVIKYKK